jgi:short-subunit dehydrogenase
MELKGKNVIVTGAGGGIGSKISERLAARGASVSLVDIAEGPLKPVAEIVAGKGVKVAAIAADITNEADIKRIVSETEKKLGPVDVLINNAGLMPFKLIKDHSEKEVLSTIMVNIYGPVRLTQAVLPGMLKRNSGRIVNVGSTFGTLAFPYFGIYSMTKGAIKNFSEALRRELQDTKVGVTYVAPRAVRSTQAPIFFEMAAKMKMNLDSPEHVAQVVVEAIETDRAEVCIGGSEKFFMLVNKLKPTLVDSGLKKQIAIMEEYCGKMKK